MTNQDIERLAEAYEWEAAKETTFANGALKPGKRYQRTLEKIENLSSRSAALWLAAANLARGCYTGNEE